MIIDFRMRPPARGFLNIGVYDNVARTAKLTECFSLKQAPSVTQKSPELMLQEMDEAGVTMGIAPGRNGHFRYNVTNDEVVEMVRHFGGRFAGIAGINGAGRAGLCGSGQYLHAGSLPVRIGLSSHAHRGFPDPVQVSVQA